MTTDMSESELKQLGNKIKATRLERSLTQAAVADKADTSPNYYAQIERGEVNPSYTLLRSIATQGQTVRSDTILVVGRL